MRKLLTMFIVFSILLCSTSCSQNNKHNDALGLAIKNIQEPLSLINERFSIFENALKSANYYLSNPTDENLQKARAACAQAVGKIAELPAASFNLSGEDLKKIMDIGINTEDYRVPFNYESYYKNDNIQTLTFIMYYLSQAPTLNDVLEYILNFETNYQAVNRKVEYLCVNELFCKFSGSEIERFKNDFLPSLTVLSADKLPWDGDSASLEAKANKLLDDAEADTDAYAEFVGDQYTALLDAQRNFKDMLLSAGIDEKEAEKIISDIDMISSQAGSLQ